MGLYRAKASLAALLLIGFLASESCRGALRTNLASEATATGEEGDRSAGTREQRDGGSFQDDLAVLAEQNNLRIPQNLADEFLREFGELRPGYFFLSPCPQDAPRSVVQLKLVRPDGGPAARLLRVHRVHFRSDGGVANLDSFRNVNGRFNSDVPLVGALVLEILRVSPSEGLSPTEGTALFLQGGVSHCVTYVVPE